MNIIAAADLNWGIGNKGQLLCHIKEDMKYFREKTTGKAVIMGRETFLSLPNGEPLKDRKNFILTTNKDFKVEGAVCCSSLEDAIEEAKREFSEDDIFLIGGERVYNYGEKYCKFAYITRIDHSFEADRHIINFDENENWEKKNEEMIKSEKGYYLTFTTYERK